MATEAVEGMWQHLTREECAEALDRAAPLADYAEDGDQEEELMPTGPEEPVVLHPDDAQPWPAAAVAEDQTPTPAAKGTQPAAPAPAPESAVESEPVPAAAAAAAAVRAPGYAWRSLSRLR
jgi:hypothetical protein